MNYKLKLGAVVGLMAFAASANAATSWVSTSTTPKLTVHQARVVSGTTPALLGTLEVDSNKPVTVVMTGSAIASMTLVNRLRDGTILNTETIAVGTTPVSRTFPSPLYFNALSTSLTTALTATNNVSVTVLQPK